MDKRTRKLLTIHKALYLFDDVDIDKNLKHRGLRIYIITKRQSLH